MHRVYSIVWALFDTRNSQLVRLSCALWWSVHCSVALLLTSLPFQWAAFAFSKSKSVSTSATQIRILIRNVCVSVLLSLWLSSFPVSVTYLSYNLSQTNMTIYHSRNPLTRVARTSVMIPGKCVASNLYTRASHKKTCPICLRISTIRVSCYIFPRNMNYIHEIFSLRSKNYSMKWSVELHRHILCSIVFFFSVLLNEFQKFSEFNVINTATGCVHCLIRPKDNNIPFAKYNAIWCRRCMHLTSGW